MHAVSSRSLGHQSNLGPRRRDGHVVQPVEPLTAVDGVEDPIPVRIAGDEDLGKRDELRAVARRLVDQVDGLLRARLGVEKYRSSLYRSGDEGFCFTHGR